MSETMDKAAAAARKALADLSLLFVDECRLTLVVRHTTDADAYLVFSNDDEIGCVAEVLEWHAEDGDNARASGWLAAESPKGTGGMGDGEAR